MITKSDAIRSLAPGAKFTNVKGVITWFSDDISQPSDSAIEAEVTNLQSQVDAEQTAKADRIASAKSKLEALGLTVEEIKEAFGI